MQLAPLAPSPFEVAYAVALVVAVVFAGYALRKMSTREWPVGFGLTLVLFTFVVPFSGPIVVGLRAWLQRRGGEPGPARTSDQAPA